MYQKYRNKFNENFTTQKYNDLIEDITADFDYKVTFRIAETPFFIDNKLKTQLIEAASQVIDFVKNDEFKLMTDKALLLNKTIPNEDNHTTFLAIDFGICEENNEIIPKLIEVQGFPSLFNFQYHLAKKFKKHYSFLSDLTPFFNNLSETDYLKILEEAICNNYSKENVILLEIEPEKQNTQIDFLYCKHDIGIPIVCVTKVFKKENQLFYKNDEGTAILIKRIYNRVIFD